MKNTTNLPLTPMNERLRMHRETSGNLTSFLIVFLIVIAAAILITGVILYFTANVDLLGIGRPDYAHLKTSPSYDRLELDVRLWQITFEKEKDSVFTGKVRHVTPIRDNNFPYLTHDILITTGDFADENKVSTSVFNHRFQWESNSSQYPQGSINLLHTVPQNEDYYNQLLNIRSGQTVTITGREILRIDLFDQGVNKGWWEDSGCNTLLVKTVLIED